MAPSGDIGFTDRELDIMNVLWEIGPATVRQVRERLPDPLAYTTVLTILRILERKGYVQHTETGRAYRYEPLVERSQAGASALRSLVKGIFRNSPELLLTQLVSDRQLSEKELLRIRRLLDLELEQR